MATYTLGDTLRNDGNGADLGEVHQLHGGAVDGTGGGKVDDGVDVRVLGNGLLDILVDGEKSLAGTPVHLAHELTTEGVDDTGDGGGGTLADEVEVEHTLDSTGLHAAVDRSIPGHHLFLWWLCAGKTTNGSVQEKKLTIRSIVSCCGKGHGC